MMMLILVCVATASMMENKTAFLYQAMAKEVAILGVGMHQWGKWGKNFVEYGIKACNDALDDAGTRRRASRLASR